MNKEIAELLNAQINKELYSAYLYMDFANYYEEQGLGGFANWYMVQVQEERDHALLIREYLLNNGEKITLEGIQKPNITYTSFRTPIEAAYAHEKSITQSIHEIYEVAHRLKDFRTTQFLDWFVKEQCEEEKNADDFLKRYDLFGNDPKGLYLLDDEMSQRVYQAPTLKL